MTRRARSAPSTWVLPTSHRSTNNPTAQGPPRHLAGRPDQLPRDQHAARGAQGAQGAPGARVRRRQEGLPHRIRWRRRRHRGDDAHHAGHRGTQAATTCTRRGATGDVAKAKELLAKSTDVEQPQPDVPRRRTTRRRSRRRRPCSRGIERTGIKVTLKPEDSELVLHRRRRRTAGLRPGAVRAGSPTSRAPNSNIQPLFDSSQIGNGGYNVVAVLEPGGRRPDRPGHRRDRPVEGAGRSGPQADKKIMEDAPVVPLVVREAVVPARFERAELLHPVVPGLPGLHDGDARQVSSHR